MNNSKKMLAVLSVPAIASILAVAVSTPAKAANRDFYDTTTTPAKVYANKDYTSNTDVLNSLITAASDHASSFVYEFGGKGYNYSTLVDNYSKEKTAGVTASSAFTKALAETSVVALPGQVTSVSAITETTNAGVVPSLPTTVKVTLSDGTTKDVNITWSAAATSTATYATAGTVNVTGTLADYNNYTVTATVTVNPAQVSVQSVSPINGQQVLVKFNKAVDATTAQTAGNYVLTNTTTTVSSAVLQADGKSVLLTLSAPVANTTTATYGITITGVASATDASQVIPAYAQAITIADTTAPTVLSVTAATSTSYANAATVTFSEPVQSGFTLKVDGTTVTSVLATDKLSATIDLSSLPLSVSTTHKLEAIGLNDASGNATSYQAVNFNVTSDTVAPAITSAAAYGDHKILVTFSKNMGTTNLATANFAVKDSYLNDIGTIASVSPLTGDTTGTKWIVDFTCPATFYTATNVTSRQVTLVVKGTGITDTVGNVLSDATKNVTLTKDTTAPSVTGVTVQKDATGAITSVTVQYNEAVTGTPAGGLQFVDSNGILQTATVGAGTVSTTDPTKVVYAVGGVSAFTGTYSVTVPASEVQDTALTQNNSAAYSGSVNFGSTTSASTFTAIATSSADKNNIIKVAFATPVKGGIGTGSATLASNYTINGAALPAGTTITLNASPEVVSGTTYAAQSVATITLPAGTVATTDTSAVLRASGIVGLNSYTLSPLVTPITVTDNTAPVLNSAVLNSDGTISIGFTNALSGLPANTTDIIVNVNGSATTATISAGTGLNSGKDVLTIANLKVDGLGAYIDADNSGTRNTGDTAVSSLTVSSAATPTAADAAGNTLVGGTTITIK